jgi:hypothetical protein
VRFPPVPLLANATESTAFILLLWQELFDEASPDSFQPRLQNIPALVEELHSVARLAAKSGQWRAHLEEIKAELGHTIDEERSILESFPKYEWTLKDLLRFDDPSQLAIATGLAMGEEPGFEDFYEASLHNVVGQLPKKKSEASRAVGNLASYAIRTGRARESFLSIVRDNLFSADAETVCAELIAGCRRRPTSYRFVAAISGDRANVRAILRNNSQLRLLLSEDKPTGAVAELFFDTHKDAAFVCGEVEGDGAAVAAKIAVRSVRTVIDTFNFFSNGLLLTTGDKVLLSAAGQSWESTDLTEQSLRRLRPRRDARQLTHQVFEILPAARLPGQILNALELHSLAHGSAAARVRLVNLWSAVECLLGSQADGSIIERVVALLAPIIVCRRVEKIVRYLAISIHRYRTEYKFSLPYAFGFANCDPHMVTSEDLLHTLSKPDGHPNLQSLAAYSNQHVLLRYQLFRAWEALSTPAELRHQLSASERRVRWQLFRIYRARNLVIHHGIDVLHATSLLDTLHYYFSVVLMRIMQTLTTNPKLRLEEAIVSLQRESRYIHECVQHNSHWLLTRDLIPEAKYRRDEPIWPAA